MICQNTRDILKYLTMILGVVANLFSTTSGTLNAWQETESQESQSQESQSQEKQSQKNNREVTSAQDKEADSVEKSTDGKSAGGLTLADVPEDIRQFMEELNAALKIGSSRRVTPKFSVPTLVKSMREMALLPEMEEEEEQELIEALQAGLRTQVRRFTQLAWTEAKWIRFERLSDERAMLLGRHYDEDGLSNPIRWWLVREGDNWKFYDLEMLDVNIRFSYFAGLGFSAGVNQSPWVRQFAPLLNQIEQLQTGMLNEEELEDLIDSTSELLDEGVHKDVPVEIRTFLMLYRASALVLLEELDEALSQLDELEKLDVPLSRFHFGGLGTTLMKKVMKDNRMPGIPELMETAKDLDVKMIACTTTLGLMGISKDTLIDGIDQLAGVTTYLAEARHGSVNLFI